MQKRKKKKKSLQIRFPFQFSLGFQTPYYYFLPKINKFWWKKKGFGDERKYLEMRAKFLFFLPADIVTSRSPGRTNRLFQSTKSFSLFFCLRFSIIYCKCQGCRKGGPGLGLFRGFCRPLVEKVILWVYAVMLLALKVKSITLLRKKNPVYRFTCVFKSSSLLIFYFSLPYGIDQEWGWNTIGVVLYPWGDFNHVKSFYIKHLVDNVIDVLF